MSVTYEVSDRVAVVTIDRPDKRNAMDESVFRGLAERAAQAGEDGEVRAVLVRGAGEHFSSGIDVNALGGQLEKGGVEPDWIAGIQDAFTAYEELDKPVVAAIEGACFGAGIQLAIACHLRAVTPSARLGVLELRWALVPDLGGTYRLPRLVGLGRATELVASGREVGAEEAVTIGLAERPVASVDEAFAWAAELARGPRSIALATRLLRDNLARSRDEALRHEREVQVARIASPEFAEAVQARFAGREPDYSGAR